MLKQWAHEAGISPNPATNDVKGFDYLLVLPKTRDSTATNPLDLDPPELSCLVQVKATRNADRPIAVKLSNWERLAKSPLPAFFLVVEVGATNKVGRAFLIHVAKEEISRVQGRLRKLKAQDRERLHKYSISLWPKAKDRLPSLDGIALLAAMRAAVGDDLRRYFSTKASWLDTVGYDKYRYHMKFRFDIGEADDLYEMMADFAIGERDQLPVVGLRVQELRFGIASDIEGHNSVRDAFLSIPTIPSQMDLGIEASDEEGLETVSITCEVRMASNVFPFLPPKYRKIALVAGGFKCILAPSAQLDQVRHATVSFHLPPPHRVGPLSEALDAAKLLRLTRRGSLHLVLVHDENRVEFGRSPAAWPDSQVTPEVLGYAAAIENAAIVMAAFGVPNDTPIRFGTLKEQEDGLRVLAAIARPTGKPLTQCVTLGPKVAEVDRKATTAAVLWTQWLTFGNKVLLAVLNTSGEPRWETSPEGALQMMLTAQVAQVRSVRVLSLAQARRFDARPLIDQALRSLETEGIELVLHPPRDASEEC